MIKSLLFCCVALAAVVVVAKLAFPLAALPLEAVQAAQTAQSPELFDDVELPDFGQVSVLDMMDYYIENPPLVTDTAESVVKKVRFQGC